MDNDTSKNVIKLVTKDKPPEETPGVTPNDLLKEAIDHYDSLIMIGWHQDSFKVSWSTELEPEEVYLQLDLAKDRLLRKMFEF